MVTSGPTAPYRRNTLTIRNADRPTWLPFTSGVIQVNRRSVGFLVGGRTRTFHLAPGEYTIGVKLGLFGRPEIGSLKFAEGERVDLVCGYRPRIPESQTWLMLVLLFGLALALGWRIAVLARGGSAAPWSPSDFGAVAAGLFLWLGWLATCLRLIGRDPGRWKRPEGGYYLERDADPKAVSAVDLDFARPRDLVAW